MTGRLRVKYILDGREPDRMPFFLRCYPEVVKTLMAAHGIGPDGINDFYGADAARTTPSYIPRRTDTGEYMDIFGNVSREVSVNGFKESAVYIRALEGVGDIDKLDEIAWPDETALDMKSSEDRVKKAHATGRCVYGGVWASLFTQSRHMVGEIEFLAGMYDNPAYIKDVVRRVTDSYLKINKAYMDAFSAYIDIYYFGSDFATQTSMFISPGMFDEFFAPEMERIVGQAKGYGKKVMYHCCGNVTPIMDTLIKIGVDIFDPVQVSASHMGPGEFAPRYKGKIAFHGGVSSQTTFTTGTPEDVYAETTAAIDAFGPYGFIPAPDHLVHPEVSYDDYCYFLERLKAKLGV